MAEVVGRVLSVASECVPLIKTGGLADVVGALPAALGELNWEVSTLLPAYSGLMAKLSAPAEVWSDADLFGGAARIFSGSIAGQRFLFLDAPHLFDRPGGPYSIEGRDHPDNSVRFAALSWSAAMVAETGLSDGWKPDIVHVHDWQTALTPYYLTRRDTGTPTVLTVHNMAFQGIASRQELEMLRLSTDDYNPELLEYYGNISTLKAGLVTAHAITTVSQTYADELMRPEFGMGLEGVIASRAEDTHGIVNGIDETIWNPQSDPGVTPYSAAKLSGKASNRGNLLAEFGLSDISGPLAILVSRLTYQKGIDLLPAALPSFIEAGGGLAVLGTGEPSLEGAMLEAAQRWPGRVAVRIGYDEALSHRMFAGADAVLVPSRFEPCGLTQLYGLRYGAIPVVSSTGGLADTVIGATPASLAAGAATGVTFTTIDEIGLSQALRRLVELYADKSVWTAMQKRGMKSDLGWRRAAQSYVSVYEQIQFR